MIQRIFATLVRRWDSAVWLVEHAGRLHAGLIPEKDDAGRATGVPQFGVRQLKGGQSQFSTGQAYVEVYRFELAGRCGSLELADAVADEICRTFDGQDIAVTGLCQPIQLIRPAPPLIDETDRGVWDTRIEYEVTVNRQRT